MTAKRAKRRFRNFYRCPCGATWRDAWDSTCDDRCPECHTSCSPYRSEDVVPEGASGLNSAKERIRELNDGFRQTFQGGRVTITSGVAELPDCVVATALVKVATFDAFNAKNDPHGEHDFGSFELCSRTFLWKIDYYDQSCRFGSDNPADPEKTTRVLTLMLAAEY